MKSLAQLTIGFGFVFVLTSCGMKYISHNELIQDHVGDSIEDLVAEFGAPRSTTKLPKGKTVYLFVNTHSKRMETAEIQRQRQTGYSSSGFRKYGGDKETTKVYENVQVSCEVSATTSKSGKVTSISSRGDGCDGKWMKEG